MLTLELADKIIEGALAYSAEQSFDPLTVAVLDAGGHMVSFKRADGSGIVRPEIASGKAYAALGWGQDGRDLTGKNPVFLGTVASSSGKPLVPAVGGVLVLDPNSGAVIGAVGISGDSAANDEAAAVAGIKGAGLGLTASMQE